MRTQIQREAEQTRESLNHQFDVLGAKIDRGLNALFEQAAIPTRDIPTVEELLEQAKTDDSKRKLLQSTLAELEFENTEVDFN